MIPYTEEERKDAIHRAIFEVALAETPEATAEVNLGQYIKAVQQELSDMEAAYLLVRGTPSGPLAPRNEDSA